MLARTIAAALLGAALLPAAAAAAPARGGAGRPAKPRPALTWPLRSDRVTLDPGATVTVRVSARGRRGNRSAAATIALTRTDLARARVVKRATLRAGRFRVTVPRAAGARYVLSARVGGSVVRRTTIVTLRATRAPVPPDGGPAPRPTPLPCATTQSEPLSGSLSGDRTALAAGETLTATFTNTNTIACLSGGIGYGVQRLVDGTWTDAGLGLRLIFPAIGVTLTPGRTQPLVFTAPTGADALPLGRYRLTKSWSGATATQPAATVESTWEFSVVPGPATPDPDRCGPVDGVARAAVTLDRATVSAGQQLVATITNSGSVCLKGELERYALFRDLGDGRREPVRVVWPDLPARYEVLQPGQSRAVPIAVLDAAQMPPGRYLASFQIWVPPTSDAIQMVDAQVFFEVTA